MCDGSGWGYVVTKLMAMAVVQLLRAWHGYFFMFTI
jgi:hypothetical protein